MNPGLSILVVDDEAEYRQLFHILLRDAGHEVDDAASAADALTKLAANAYDLVLSDLVMPNMDGIGLLRAMKAMGVPAEVIIVTGYGSIRNAVEAIRSGAFSYFIKGTDPGELLHEIEKINRLKQIVRTELDLNEPLLSASASPKMRQVEHVVEKVAATDLSVLLSGESGVGKEVLARHVHDNSLRKDGPFVAINCQAFPENLLEAELFGYEKGAFTGAVGRRIGRFEEAQGGTFFLDEALELSPAIQVKLLRVLENRSIERLGSNKSIDIDIRLISATNKSAKEEIAASRFRQDLLFRINAVNIQIPPLRERREDLDMFISYFVARFSRKYNRAVTAISDEASEFLKTYPFPGNVRELSNIIEKLVVFSQEGQIELDESVVPTDYAQPSTGIDSRSLRELRKETEKSYIEKVLIHYNYDIGEAANHLGITKRHLFNKISEFGLKY
ncbi:DNA-binding NtrC family response regulator [Breoghania corrubedonensis]|uniref:DNA-binding NtrC family response regulator n=1 Tax=Breoghania corrubedonensis TaxID=665038 RepID=A0A2T5V8W4_9HYPH|nr:sigma-54 dependent transcriptional regulator [Breoghania corrubedonensis]PTW60193.1 DNA-binding NtrC family response regulator [Breoghania corrubedonensis]